MRTYFDCIPCFVRQSLDSIRFVTADENIQESVIRRVLAMVSEMDLRESPPAMAQRIHRMIRDLADDPDPYREVKRKFTAFALDLYPELKGLVARSRDPFETSLRLALAGNVIDFGVRLDIRTDDVHQTIEDALEAPLDTTMLTKLRDAINTADDVLYLLDNAGEIVFDRLFIEQLPCGKVTCVVKGGPVINDATVEDAKAAGFDGLVPIINNGFDAPGTILRKSSEAFQRRFARADLVIAKGQGNYETLNEESKRIFFLLKAKCPVIARDAGCETGSFLVLEKQA